MKKKSQTIFAYAKNSIDFSKSHIYKYGAASSSLNMIFFLLTGVVYFLRMVKNYRTSLQNKGYTKNLSKFVKKKDLLIYTWLQLHTIIFFHEKCTKSNFCKTKKRIENCISFYEDNYLIFNF